MREVDRRLPAALEQAPSSPAAFHRVRCGDA